LQPAASSTLSLVLRRAWLAANNKKMEKKMEKKYSQAALLGSCK